MLKKFQFKKGVIFMVLSSGLMSCSKKDERAPRALTVNFQEGDLPTLHPHDLVIHLRGISIAKLLYEGLTRIDENGKIHLSGAESLDISKDGLRYTFKIRKNAWSDGTPVTAAHFENAWKEALSPSSPCSRADLLYMIKNGERAKRGEVPLDEVGVQAVDARTLIVELAHPSSFFLDLAAQPICAPLKDPKSRQGVVCNGPFCVEAHERNYCLKLQKNPYFWNEKKISLQEINVYMMADSSSIHAAYESGEIDWIGLPLSPLNREQIHSIRQNEEMISHPVERSFWIHLNTRARPLSSPAIRRALSLALDRAEIVRHILVGGRPLHRALPSALLPAKPKSGSLLKEDWKEAKLRFQQGLAELGLSREEFPPLTVSFAQQSNRKQFAEYLKATWEEVLGIRIHLEQLEWNVQRANLETGNFEISASFEAAYYNDPLEILEKLGIAYPANFTQWEHTGYRALISLARMEKNRQRRLDLLAKAEEILLSEMPFIPVCTDQFLFTHRSGLRGYAFDSLGAVDFSYASPVPNQRFVFAHRRGLQGYAFDSLGAVDFSYAFLNGS